MYTATSDCASCRSASRPTRASPTPARRTRRRSTRCWSRSRNGEGFIKIIGEVGTGKTLLCRRFLATLDASYVSGLHPQPVPRAARRCCSRSPRSWAWRCRRDADQHQLLKEPHHAPARLRAPGQDAWCCASTRRRRCRSRRSKRCGCSPTSRPRSASCCRSCCSASPSSTSKLAQESVRQLRQRITFQYRARRARPRRGRRLRRAPPARRRLPRQPLFTAAALALHRRSGGVPRLVNIVAHKAMLLAYGEGVQRSSAATCARRRATRRRRPPAGRGWWPRWRFGRATD